MAELKNPRHELFAQNVAKGMTLEAAYEAAKFKPHRGNAATLRAKQIISERISELQAQIAQKVVEQEVVSKTEILAELKRIALSDVGHFYDTDGTMRPFADIPEDQRRAIAAVEVKEEFEMENGRKVFTGYTKKLKLWDKNKALENLGRHQKLFTDKVEHSGTVDLAERMKRARERRSGKS